MDDLKIQVRLYGDSHYRNFKRLCWKLAYNGDVKKLKSFLIVEIGYKRKLADCAENDLLLECIEKAKQRKKEIQANKSVKHFAYTCNCCVSGENLKTRSYYKN